MELRRGSRGIVRIGHRGAAALAADNSLESLALAVELGVDVVEFDVLRAPDGRLVVSHDASAASRNGAASLEEALELLDGLGVGLHLDLKSPGVEARIADALRARSLVERTFVSSVSREVLRTLRAVEPELRRAVGYPDDHLGVSRWPRLDPVVRGGLGA
ncbi:MAG: glycerophosphoryl diester phosphodiesterase, partial [Actinomycetota bacterium]